MRARKELSTETNFVGVSDAGGAGMKGGCIFIFLGFFFPMEDKSLKERFRCVITWDVSKRDEKSFNPNLLSLHGKRSLTNFLFFFCPSCNHGFHAANPSGDY